MAKKGLSELLRRVFTVEKGEKNGILALLPLLGVVAIFLHGIEWRKADTALLEKADSILSAIVVNPDAFNEGKLFYFDPNTVTLEQLCELGFELRVAASIIKYRNAGKRFNTPEDLAMCYGVTLEKYRELEPYITIDPQFTALTSGGTRSPDDRKPAKTFDPENAGGSSIKEPSAPFDPNATDLSGFMALGFTESQARTIINYRTSTGGFRSVEQFGRCYAVSGEALELLAPYIVISPLTDTETVAGSLDTDAAGGPVAGKIKVELNSADSSALRTIRGIGEVLVVRILDYRQRLGGFVRIEQLAEIEGMTEANFERISGQITVDSCIISKIDINFAPHKELAERLGRHPYMDARKIRRLLSARQLKGGWSNTRELADDKIWNEEDAVKMAPYIVFRPLDN